MLLAVWMGKWDKYCCNVRAAMSKIRNICFSQTEQKKLREKIGKYIKKERRIHSCKQKLHILKIIDSACLEFLIGKQNCFLSNL
jgi:hypothetical protein